MTDKQLSPMESFKEKVQNKLKDDMADMLPDDVLAKLVEEAVKDLFKERRREGTYGWQSEHSWLQELVRQYAEGRIRTAVDAYIKEHDAELRVLIHDAVAELMPSLVQRQTHSLEKMAEAMEAIHLHMSTR